MTQAVAVATCTMLLSSPDCIKEIVEVNTKCTLYMYSLIFGIIMKNFAICFLYLSCVSILERSNVGIVSQVGNWK